MWAQMIVSHTEQSNHKEKTRESIKIIYQLNYEMPVYEIGLN